MLNWGFVKKKDDGRDSASGPKRISKKASAQDKTDHRGRWATRRANLDQKQWMTSFFISLASFKSWANQGKLRPSGFYWNIRMISQHRLKFLQGKNQFKPDQVGPRQEGSCIQLAAVGPLPAALLPRSYSFLGQMAFIWFITPVSAFDRQLMEKIGHLTAKARKSNCCRHTSAKKKLTSKEKQEARNRLNQIPATFCVFAQTLPLKKNNNNK